MKPQYIGLQQQCTANCFQQCLSNFNRFPHSGHRLTLGTNVWETDGFQQKYLSQPIRILSHISKLQQILQQLLNKLKITRKECLKNVYDGMSQLMGNSWQQKDGFKGILERIVEGTSEDEKRVSCSDVAWLVSNLQKAESNGYQQINKLGREQCEKINKMVRQKLDGVSEMLHKYDSVSELDEQDSVSELDEQDSGSELDEQDSGSQSSIGQISFSNNQSTLSLNTQNQHSVSNQVSNVQMADSSQISTIQLPIQQCHHIALHHNDWSILSLFSHQEGYYINKFQKMQHQLFSRIKKLIKSNQKLCEQNHNQNITIISLFICLFLFVIFFAFIMSFPRNVIITYPRPQLQVIQYHWHHQPIIQQNIINPPCHQQPQTLKIPGPSDQFNIPATYTFMQPHQPQQKTPSSSNFRSFSGWEDLAI